ncbi:Vps13 [Symbiodinium microadriaticum]|nr:Vps13 [Symbiodinium microadriaticum]
MGGPHLKETSHLGIWDAFILHLCGFSEKLPLCRKICQSGMLRNFSFQADVDNQPHKLAGPLWQASLEVLAAAVESCPFGWPACTGTLHPNCMSKFEMMELQPPAVLVIPHLRAEWGNKMVTAKSVRKIGLSRPVALWQMCDYVRGTPPPCHPVLGQLDPSQLWWCSWDLPSNADFERVLARLSLSRAQLHLYPPGVRIQLEPPGAEQLLFWILKGTATTSSTRVEAGRALIIPRGEVLVGLAITAVVALSGFRSGEAHDKDPIASSSKKQTATIHVSSAGSLCPLVDAGGWQWFGNPENWLGAPRGHEPVDQVAAARQQEALKAKPFAKARAVLSRDAKFVQVIPYAEIALDSTDLTVDDHWLDRLARLASQARSASQSSKSALPDMLRLAGKPIVEEYVVPSCPRIVQIDALHISSIAVRVWCSIRLDSVRFLPGYVRSAIRLLSLSARFHLDGASVSLPRRRLPPYRGSVSDFLGCLTAEYTVNFLHNVGAVLGRSSVLKLPRVPLKIGGTAVSYVTDSIGLAAGEAAALLNKLTFDEDFVAKQREQQGTKRIRGLGDGVVEASKSIAQGVEGVMDVVKKPVQGARSSGLSGFLMGVGIGMAGSFVKPVSRVGQAISDVGSGLAAELAPDSGPTQRHRARVRKRQPRLFFSVPTSTADLMDDAGPSHLRPFSDLEAATLHHLGSSRLRGLQEVVPLTTSQHGTQVAVLLLFGTHCLLADIPFHVCQEAAEAKNTAASKRSGGASARLTAQALKPINTVVYGIQDLSRPSQSSAEPDDTAQRQVRGFHFKDMTAVSEMDDGRVIELHADSISGTLALPLFSAPLGQASRDALVSGFRSALEDERIASWSTFSKTFRSEDQRSRLLERQGDAAAGAGLRKLVVWEVERRLPTASEWKTPFLPTDAGLTWRWVDTRGRRHPNLSLGLTRLQAAGSKTPPCRIGSLYRPTSDWQLETGPETDHHGWSYGMAWNSSSWEAAPSPLEVLRRRRWTRTFT